MCAESLPQTDPPGTTLFTCDEYWKASLGPAGVGAIDAPAYHRNGGGLDLSAVCAEAPAGNHVKKIKEKKRCNSGCTGAITSFMISRTRPAPPSPTTTGCPLSCMHGHALATSLPAPCAPVPNAEPFAQRHQTSECPRTPSTLGYFFGGPPLKFYRPEPGSQTGVRQHAPGRQCGRGVVRVWAADLYVHRLHGYTDCSPPAGMDLTPAASAVSKTTTTCGNMHTPDQDCT